MKPLSGFEPNVRRRGWNLFKEREINVNTTALVIIVRVAVANRLLNV